MRRSKITLRVLLCSFFGVIFAYTSDAATIRSQANGNWSNINTWVGGVLPANNDDVIILTGTIVNLNFSLPSTSAFLSLTIQPGATLIVTVNSSTFRVKGNLINNGVLNLWQANNLQADLTLYGNSTWSGNGTWNLSGVNLQGNVLELSSGMSLTVNGTISASPGGNFNKVNQYTDINLNFMGTANSTLPALASDFYYGNITVNKISGTVSFLPSISNNNINFSGNLNLINANDRLIINDYNTLTIRGAVNGLGEIAGGGNTSSLIIDNVLAPQINPLRVSSGISLKNFVVNRAAGVVLAFGFTIRDNLTLNNLCRLTLSAQTLSLGVNIAPPAPGIFSGNGYLVGSPVSSISVRGNNPSPTYLRFGQLSSAEYTLNNLVVDKLSGTTGLYDGSNLNITGFIDVYDNNLYAIGPATLTLNSVPHFFDTGSLEGSEQSSLVIAGNGITDYSLQFDQSTASGHTLKSYRQSRNANITLANKLNLAEGLNLSGNSSRLTSNGNLTIVSSATRNAGIEPLLNSAAIIGNVSVQSYFTGGAGMRGTRTLSSPVTPAASPSVYKQLQNFMFITGSGIGGFDNPGSSPSLFNYKESASIQDGAPAQFTAVTDLNTSVLAGEGFFLLFRGDRFTNTANKLNPPFAVPESFAVTYTGPINKGIISIPATVLTYTNRTEDFRDAAYNGYHLIGNPYPSTINWELVSKVNMENIVSVVKPGGGMITYSNGFVTNGGPPGTSTTTNTTVLSGLPYIQTGQGFYVKAKPGGGTITFTESCKSVLASPDRLLGKPAEEILQSATVLFPEIKGKKAGNFIRLELCNTKNTDETIIVFTEGGDAAYSTGDAVHFAGSTVSLSSQTADMQNVAINFMPAVDQIQNVKLKVDAIAHGNVKLRFTDIHLPKNFEVFLEDGYLRTLTNVRNQCVYEFIIDKTNPDTFGSARFSIVLKDISPVMINEINVYPNPVSNILNVEVPAGNIGDMRWAVYDVMGYKCLSGAGVHPYVGDLQAGLYLIKVTDTRNNKVVGRSKFLKE